MSASEFADACTDGANDAAASDARASRSASLRAVSIVASAESMSA